MPWRRAESGEDEDGDVDAVGAASFDEEDDDAAEELEEEVVVEVGVSFVGTPSSSSLELELVPLLVPDEVSDDISSMSTPCCLADLRAISRVSTVWRRSPANLTIA